MKQGHVPPATSSIIVDIIAHTFMVPGSLYVCPAVLMSADSTTKAESAGLMAHMFSVLQVTKDLQSVVKL